MCLDISFKIDETEDSLLEYLPNLIIDPQLDIVFEINSHIQAHSRPLSKIIYTNNNGDPYLTMMRWGVLMKYMFKDVASFNMYANNSYNIKAEKILEKSSSWNRIRHQRCLIDTPGIYEHRAIDGWKNKVPYFIRLCSNKRMLIPGLYFFLDLSKEDIEKIKAINDKSMIEVLNKVLNLETGQIIGTYGMITRYANEKMRNIHNHGPNKHRMPLFMEPEQAVKWIDPNLTDEEMKAMLDYNIPSEDLNEIPVSTIRTTRPRLDGKMKHERFDWPGLPPLGQDRPLINDLFG